MIKIEWGVPSKVKVIDVINLIKEDLKHKNNYEVIGAVQVWSTQKWYPRWIMSFENMLKNKDYIYEGDYTSIIRLPNVGRKCIHVFRHYLYNNFGVDIVPDGMHCGKLGDFKYEKTN